MSFFEADDDLRVVRRDAALILRLHEREIQVLQWVLADLGRVLAEESAADAVTQRLFPRAYLDPTEERAEAEWQSEAHDDLVELRRTAIEVVGLDLDSAEPARGRDAMREVVLDPERAEQWMGTLNDARLALGTALGLIAETDFEALEPDDPRVEPYLVYDWLTHLLGALLGAVAGPETDEEDPADPGGDG